MQKDEIYSHLPYKENIDSPKAILFFAVFPQYASHAKKNLTLVKAIAFQIILIGNSSALSC